MFVNFIVNIGLVGRVFANGEEDRGSIWRRVISKTQKMVFDATLLNAQCYKVRIKSKVEQSSERNSTLPNTCVLNCSINWLNFIAMIWKQECQFQTDPLYGEFVERIINLYFWDNVPGKTLRESFKKF